MKGLFNSLFVLWTTLYNDLSWFHNKIKVYHGAFIITWVYFPGLFDDNGITSTFESTESTFLSILPIWCQWMARNCGFSYMPTFYCCQHLSVKTYVVIQPRHIANKCRLEIKPGGRVGILLCHNLDIRNYMFIRFGKRRLRWHHMGAKKFHFTDPKIALQG